MPHRARGPRLATVRVGRQPDDPGGAGEQGASQASRARGGRDEELVERGTPERTARHVRRWQPDNSGEPAGRVVPLDDGAAADSNPDSELRFSRHRLSHDDDLDDLFNDPAITE